MNRTRAIFALPLTLFALLLTLAASAPVQAGTPYTAAVGTPPVITSLAWKAWYNRLLAYRLAEVSSPRATTYFFAANGNDATGAGTQALPYQTLAKAQTLLAANVRLRFRRGDIFYGYPAAGVAALEINVPHVTVDDYGPSAYSKPQFSRFNTPYTASNWSLTAGTANGRCWQAAENATISWLREQGVINAIYRKMSSTASVDATPGSWWQDTTAHLIYVNPNGNTVAAANPSVGYRYFEGVTANTNAAIRYGFTASSDDIWIQNIRMDGWTANIADNGGDGIHGYNSGTDACYMRGVDVYYCDRHCVVNTAPTGTTGGITTLVQCKYGWTTSPTSASNTALYAPLGGQEAVWQECESWGDMLPTGATPYSNATQNDTAQLAHSDGSAGHNCALFAAYGCWNRPGQWQAGSPSSCACPIPWTDLINCRAFVVNETFTVREPTTLDLSPSRPTTSQSGTAGIGYGGLNCATVNCNFTTRVLWMTADSDLFYTSNPSLGFMLNCSLLCDSSTITLSGAGGAKRCISQGAGGSLYNCRMQVKVGGVNNYVFASQYVSNTPATTTTTLQMYNTIFAAEGADTQPFSYFAPGIGNLAANQINNAYSNASLAHKTQAEGYDQDPFYVEVSDLPFGHPSSDSPLLSAHNQLVQGVYRLEYDADWNPRSLTTPAIGPYEPVSSPAIAGRGRRLN